MCRLLGVSTQTFGWHRGVDCDYLATSALHAQAGRYPVRRKVTCLIGMRRDNGEVFAVRASGEFGDFLEARAAMARVKMQLELTIGQGMTAVETDHFVYRGKDRVADLKAEISPHGHPRVVLFVGVRD